MPMVVPFATFQARTTGAPGVIIIGVALKDTMRTSIGSRRRDGDRLRGGSPTPTAGS